MVMFTLVSRSVRNITYSDSVTVHHGRIVYPHTQAAISLAQTVGRSVLHIFSPSCRRSLFLSPILHRNTNQSHTQGPLWMVMTTGKNEVNASIDASSHFPSPFLLSRCCRPALGDERGFRRRRAGSAHRQGQPTGVVTAHPGWSQRLKSTGAVFGDRGRRNRFLITVLREQRSCALPAQRFCKIAPERVEVAGTCERARKVGGCFNLPPPHTRAHTLDEVLVE